MIFVPCKDGISHNESEWTTFDECAAGAQVLLNSVLAYDRQFAGELDPEHHQSTSMDRD